jgi:hypothetical protein
VPQVAAAPAAEEPLVLILDESTVPSPKLETDSGATATSTIVITGVTLGLTAGYVLLEVRNFYWLASLLAALPTWRQFDPLTVLDAWDKAAGKRRQRQADEDDEEAAMRAVFD